MRTNESTAEEGRKLKALEHHQHLLDRLTWNKANTMNDNSNNENEDKLG